MRESKDIETVLPKHQKMEEANEMVMKGRSVIGAVARVLKGREAFIEVKRGLRNSIIWPALMYGSET